MSFRIAIDLTGLRGTQTVDVYYKNPAGKVVILYRFTVITSTLTDVPLPTVTPTVHATLPEGYGATAADTVYKGDDDAVLYTFENKTKADFDAACAYYTGSGYAVYRATEKAGNHFATLTKGTAMAHVYWFEALSELNIVISDTAAHNLPPVTPAVTDGEVPCTIVQLKDSSHVNGMSYVIQLKDGSYIIYDGSYESQAEQLLSYLKDNHVGEGKPLVRAWVLTHSHSDHYPSFYKIARRWAEEITVEYILLNPLSDEEFELNDEEIYLSTYFPYDAARFAGAKTVYVHTGMEFVFCNLTMEVLWSPADLYKDVTVKTIANRPLNFNNTSVVTRLYDDGYSAMFTGDIGKAGATVMESIYGSYLRSDVCQVSHHGVEDVPLSFYEAVKAPMLFYPCSVSLYDMEGRNSDVRIALERKAYTKEILIAGIDSFKRAWGHTYEADAPVSMPAASNACILHTR